MKSFKKFFGSIGRKKRRGGFDTSPSTTEGQSNRGEAQLVSYRPTEDRVTFYPDRSTDTKKDIHGSKSSLGSIFGLKKTKRVETSEDPPFTIEPPYLTKSVGQDVKALATMGLVLEEDMTSLGNQSELRVGRYGEQVKKIVGKDGKPLKNVIPGKSFALKYIDLEFRNFVLDSVVNRGSRHGMEQYDLKVIPNHPNIVPIRLIVNMGQSVVRKVGGTEYKNYQRVYVVMDYTDFGSLKDYLTQLKAKNQTLDEYHCLRFIRDVYSGVKYLHDLKLGHAYVFDTNLLVFRDGNEEPPKYSLKLSDPGMSLVFDGKYYATESVSDSEKKRLYRLDVGDMSEVIKAIYKQSTCAETWKGIISKLIIRLDSPYVLTLNDQQIIKTMDTIEIELFTDSHRDGKKEEPMPSPKGVPTKPKEVWTPPPASSIPQRMQKDIDLLAKMGIHITSKSALKGPKWGEVMVGYYGGQARDRLGVNVEPDQLFAFKTIYTDMKNPTDDGFGNYVDVSRYAKAQYNHQNITPIRLIISMDEAVPRKIDGRSKRCYERVFVFMDFADFGSLNDYFATLETQNQRIIEYHCIKFIAGLYSGLKYLHDCQTFHGYLHIGNVLLFLTGREPTAKLSDYGLSVEVDEAYMTFPVVNDKVRRQMIVQDVHGLGVIFNEIHTRSDCKKNWSKTISEVIGLSTREQSKNLGLKDPRIAQRMFLLEHYFLDRIQSDG